MQLIKNIKKKNEKKNLFRVLCTVFSTIYLFSNLSSTSMEFSGSTSGVDLSNREILPSEIYSYVDVDESYAVEPTANNIFSTASAIVKAKIVSIGTPRFVGDNNSEPQTQFYYK